MNNIKLIPLTYTMMKREDLQHCALLAAEAFADYEYFSLYISNERRRQRFLNALIHCEFKANWERNGCVFFIAKENKKTVAVAQLCSPEFVRPSDGDYLKAGWMKVWLGGGFKKVNAWSAMEELASAPCHDFEGKHWYLSLFTVKKEDEGKGIGSAFLKECLIPFVKRANGEVLTLFTNSVANCKFYEKNGFSLLDEKKFEYNGKSIGNWSYMMML